MENAKVIKKGENIEIRNLSEREYNALFKCDIVGTINFIDDSGNLIDYIYLNERKFDGRDNVINISTNMNPDGIDVGYGYLEDIFNQLSELGERVFIMTESYYVEKYPLMELISTLNVDLVANATVFGYAHSVFSMINIPEPTGESNKLFYFELNDSLIVFSSNGPSIHFEGYSSVMDILCQ